MRLIARDEWRLLWRSRVSVVGLALLGLLTAVATLSSWASQRDTAEARARHQATAQRAFAAQPDRHPHRMVHYGQFVYRPLGPLAAFDPGVDAFTGSSMFLEGHRQNSANFGDAQQSSLLVRFGQLTPAFVLQAVAPLLLVFLGFGALARETEGGTLRLLLLQGATRAELVGGKLLALVGMAGLAGSPALVGLLLLAARPGGAALPVAALALGYLAYLVLWSVLILLVSARARRRRDALLALVALWAVTAVLLPRAGADLAGAAVPLPNRLQTEVAIARDLRNLGDSHNPNDPHFLAFKKTVLARYGVARVDDLPVNYKGLASLEGERLTAALFDRYAARGFAAQARQSRLVASLSGLSPTVALRGLSMAAAGTDLAGHRRFLEQAEAYRYTLVQRLNRMQAGDVRFADEAAEDAGADRRKRIAAAHWREVPDFRFVAPTGAAAARGALPGLLALLAWLTVAAGLLSRATRRLGARA